MKKVSHSKANLALVGLMAMWSITLLVKWLIPSLFSAAQFVSDDTTKYGIIGGYYDDFFIQRHVIYYILNCIFETLSFLIFVVLLAALLFKPKMIKIVGIILIIQNVILLSIQVWDRFCINPLESKINIDIWWNLCIAFIITAILIYLSSKQKFFYMILAFVTLLRGANTLAFMFENNIDNIYVIFNCFDCLFPMILYWLLILEQYKHNKQQLTMIN